jgi:hypothetical protein
LRVGKAVVVTAAAAGIVLALLSMRSPRGRRIRPSEALAAEPIVVPLAAEKAKPQPPVEAPPPRPEIPELAAPWLEDIAAASIGGHGAVIYVNPKRCAELGTLVCAFFRQHEQGHVKLHHGGPRYTEFVGGRELAEEEADCYAARHATLFEVKATIEFFRKPKYVDSALGEHATGAQRAEQIRLCRGL